MFHSVGNRTGPERITYPSLMSHDKLRRELAAEAAKLIRTGRENNLPRARISAARRVSRGWIHPADLPEEVEIRDELARHTWMVDGEDREGLSHPADDRFRHYRLLLTPLEQFIQHRNRHPEGDALYHSLQVFRLAREASPWDEEFQLAALLHDVGKAIDPRDHVAAGIAALGETITDRTAWLIENHPDAQRLHEGTLGERARLRLHDHPDYRPLLELARCDREGRVPGAEVPTLDEALQQIQDLAELCGDE
jgi:hypothetical protein